MNLNPLLFLVFLRFVMEEAVICDDDHPGISHFAQSSDGLRVALQMFIGTRELQLAFMTIAVQFFPMHDKKPFGAYA